MGGNDALLLQLVPDSVEDSTARRDHDDPDDTKIQDS